MECFRIHVLGSAAGGGLPQWNCGGENSMRARGHDLSIPPRTQPSIAVSADGERWSIVNTSPDIRQQFADFGGLHPNPGTRDIPLDTVVITNPDLDHTIGLLVLRESLPYRVVSTPWTRSAILRHNACFRLIEPVWEATEIGKPFYLDQNNCLEARFSSSPGKVPIYLKSLEENHPEATVALQITDLRTKRKVVYAPGIQTLNDSILAELADADCRFVDGTFFTENELLDLRPDAQSATKMGHTPVSGDQGSLDRFAGLPGRTLYIHMNNTNPMLNSNSAAAAQVRSTGIEIAFDGMDFDV